jgi:hypothetical protein
MDGQEDMMKPIIHHFPNFANAPKNPHYGVVV